MKKSILFFCILSFVFIVPFTYADSTKIASIIPHDPIIKKIYPLNRMNVMLNGSKGRVWLSRASFFGYLDNNDYLYDYTEVTNNAWRVKLTLIQ